MKNQLIRVTGLCMGLVMMTACGSSRKSGWDQGSSTVTLTDSEKKQLQSEVEKHWKSRNVRTELEAALKKLKTLAEANPTDYDTLVKLARGHYLLADGILQEMSEKKATWEMGVSWAERAMATEPAFKAAVVDQKKSVSEAVQFLNKDKIDALYWSAASLGKWAKNSGIATTLQYKGQIKAMIERVGQLDPNYFYGAYQRYWGVYYAVAPGFAGGSMEKSLESFQKSIKIANYYLGTHVLFAENYAAKKGDRELFKKELNFVLSAKADAIPELTPENTLEKEKAKRMLESMEEYF